MPRRVWRALGAALLGAVCARAGTITASLDTDSATKGVAFLLVVQINGDDVTDFSIPTIDGAVISDEPVKSGSQVKVVNGSAAFVQYYVFSVTPERVGDLVIPPFTASSKAGPIKTEPLRVNVEDSPTATDSTTQSIAGDQVLFIQIKVDKTEAYRGEPIALSMEAWILSGVGVGPYEPVGFPELTGFYALPREPGDPTQRTDTRDGKQYTVVTFSQTLFPASSGDLRVGPWTWSSGISYRGVARNREVKTDPFTIKVKPLPAAPPGFSGSVGTYQVVASIAPKATDVGVPITLTVGIVGDGNPDAIGAPRLPDVDGVYVDEPKRMSLGTGTPGQGGANFVYKVTPQRAGNIRIPPIQYVYFEPEQETFETAQTSALTLQVRGTSKPEDQVVVGAGGAENMTESLGSDILEPVTDPGPLNRNGDRTIPTALGCAAPALAYAAFALYLRRRRRFETDIAFARAHGALRSGLERLGLARQNGSAADALYQAVTHYIADQFNLPETGMTSAEAQIFFQSHQVPAEVADAFQRILRTCERARYAAAELSADEIEALIQGAQTGMERLDEHLKQRRAA